MYLLVRLHVTSLRPIPPVYLAEDLLRHERKVALEVLKPDLAAVVGADRFLDVRLLAPTAPLSDVERGPEPVNDNGTLMGIN